MFKLQWMTENILLPRHTNYWGVRGEGRGQLVKGCLHFLLHVLLLDVRVKSFPLFPAVDEAYRCSACLIWYNSVYFWRFWSWHIWTASICYIVWITQNAYRLSDLGLLEYRIAVLWLLQNWFRFYSSAREASSAALIFPGASTHSAWDHYRSLILEKRRSRSHRKWWCYLEGCRHVIRHKIHINYVI